MTVPGFRPHPLGMASDPEALQDLQDGIAEGIGRYTCRLHPEEQDEAMEAAYDAIVADMLPGLVELIDARLAAVADDGGPVRAR